MTVFKSARRILENIDIFLCPNASQAGLNVIRFLQFKLSNSKKANVSRAELKLYSQYIDTADGKKIWNIGTFNEEDYKNTISPLLSGHLKEYTMTKKTSK